MLHQLDAVYDLFVYVLRGASWYLDEGVKASVDVEVLRLPAVVQLRASLAGGYAGYHTTYNRPFCKYALANCAACFNLSAELL